MDAEEKYVEEITELEDSYLEEKKRIIYDYAQAVCPYHKGDIVKDADGYIRITRLLVTYVKDDLPLVQVSGVVLNRHKEERRDGKTRTINAENIIK